MLAVDEKLVSDLMDCNFLDIIPDDVRELLANVRIKHTAFRNTYADERKPLKLSKEDGKKFSQYYNREGKENLLCQIKEDKKNLIDQITSQILVSLPKEDESNKKGENISKNQVRKKNRKERHKRNQRRRAKKRNQQKIASSASSCGESESDDEKYSVESIQRELEGIVENDACTEKKRLERIKQLVLDFEEVENALFDLINHPYFESRESVCEQFASVIESLFSAKSFHKDNFKKVKGMVDILSEPANSSVYDVHEDEHEDKQNEREDEISKDDEEVEPDDPDQVDQEEYARKFMKALLEIDMSDFFFRFGRFYGTQETDKMASFIARERGNILKQKVVEVGMFDLLRILKSCVFNQQLYVTLSIFRVVMALPCARKYWWRDPEFYPTLGYYATYIDTDFNRKNKHQTRNDAVHIIFISLLAAPKDAFQIVADAGILEQLIKHMKTPPISAWGAYAGIDVMDTITLMTEYWDLFEADIRRLNVLGRLKKWRKHALYYSYAMPNLPWNLDDLCLRLKVLLKSREIIRNQPDFRVSAPKLMKSSQENTKKKNVTACSNPKCYQLNELGNGTRYKKCSKCNLSYYCSKKCQCDHWATHKIWCKRPTWNEKPSIESTEKKKLANQSSPLVVDYA